MANWLKCKDGIFNADQVSGIIILEIRQGAKTIYRVAALLPTGKVHIEISDHVSREDAVAYVEATKDSILIGGL